MYVSIFGITRGDVAVQQMIVSAGKQIETLICTIIAVHKSADVAGRL